jgi:uncharacterized protein YdeI (BOF family)
MACRIWRGLSVDENDMVEISGEIEVEVKSIQKL